ncbi:MAG: hypothetical protein QOF48_1273, partial [Verrucomicrobiota bacterium]
MAVGHGKDEIVQGGTHAVVRTWWMIALLLVMPAQAAWTHPRGDAGQAAYSGLPGIGDGSVVWQSGDVAYSGWPRAIVGSEFLTDCIPAPGQTDPVSDICARRLADGQETWQVSLDGTRSSSAPISDEARIYVLVARGDKLYLTATSASTHVKVWETLVSSVAAAYAGQLQYSDNLMAVDANHVYLTGVPTLSGVFAFDAATGVNAWNATDTDLGFDGEFTRLAIAGREVVASFHKQDGSPGLVAISANSGVLAWKIARPGETVLACADQLVYGQFVLSPADGSLIRTLESSAYACSGNVAIGSCADLCAMSTQTGQTLWRFVHQNHAALWLLPVFGSGVLFTGDQEFTYALRLDNGAIVWKNTPAESTSWLQGPIASGGKLIQKSGNGFRALNVEGGSLASASTSTSSAITTSSTASATSSGTNAPAENTPTTATVALNTAPCASSASSINVRSADMGVGWIVGEEPTDQASTLSGGVQDSTSSFAKQSGVSLITATHTFVSSAAALAYFTQQKQGIEEQYTTSNVGDHGLYWTLGDANYPRDLFVKDCAVWLFELDGQMGVVEPNIGYLW